MPANFEPFRYMRVYDNPADPCCGGGFIFGEDYWPLEDLPSEFASATNELTLRPNFAQYGPDNFWSDGNGHGNKILEATTRFEPTLRSGRVIPPGNVDANALAADTIDKRLRALRVEGEMGLGWGSSPRACCAHRYRSACIIWPPFPPPAVLPTLTLACCQCRNVRWLCDVRRSGRVEHSGRRLQRPSLPPSPRWILPVSNKPPQWFSRRDFVCRAASGHYGRRGLHSGAV